MKIRITENRLSRRRFLTGTAAIGAAGFVGIAAPRISRAAARPLITHGIQSGDVGADRAVLWSRADRPANAVFEWSTTESFKNVRSLPKLAALPETDYTVKLLATDLPSNQDIFYRVRFQDLADTTVESEPLTGHFRTAPTALRDVSFTWSGDTCGQGWGIDEDRGGMKAYSTMLKHQPDFFLHSGDNIYADGVVQAEVTLPDGSTWKNIVTPEKSKPAETRLEFMPGARSVVTSGDWSRLRVTSLALKRRRPPNTSFGSSYWPSMIGATTGKVRLLSPGRRPWMLKAATEK